MDRKQVEFYGKLGQKAASDAVYCRLAAEHRAASDRLLQELAAMTDVQRDAVLEYLGLVAQTQSRLLLLSGDEKESR